MGWLKNFLSEKYLKLIIGVLFDSALGIKLLGWTKGKEKSIGRFILFLSMVVAAAQTVWPTLPYVSAVNVWFPLVAGYVATELGIAREDYNTKMLNMKSGD